jgi:hypothetical protein
MPHQRTRSNSFGYRTGVLWHQVRDAVRSPFRSAKERGDTGPTRDVAIAVVKLDSDEIIEDPSVAIRDEPDGAQPESGSDVRIIGSYRAPRAAQGH